jgi:hypothetical protein
VLDAVGRLERRHGRQNLELHEIVTETLAQDPQFKESTVRTFDDLERVGRGVYRRR